jgi:hypothetical protein
MNGECDHEPVRRGTMKELKEALRRREQKNGTASRGWRDLPWGGQRFVNGRESHRPDPVEPHHHDVGGSDAIYDTEEERD